MGRFCVGADASAVAAFLSSPEAGFVTGAVEPVDGGHTILGQDPEARDVPAGWLAGWLAQGFDLHRGGMGTRSVCG